VQEATKDRNSVLSFSTALKQRINQRTDNSTASEITAQTNISLEIHEHGVISDCATLLVGTSYELGGRA
jgi:hypothetical protein